MTMSRCWEVFREAGNQLADGHITVAEAAAETLPYFQVPHSPEEATVASFLKGVLYAAEEAPRDAEADAIEAKAAE